MNASVKRRAPGVCLGIIAAVLLVTGPVLAGQAQGQAQAQTQQAQQPQQQPESRPVTVDQPMPDFTLPTYQGGAVMLSQLKGKNVMIIFSRGYAAQSYWCTICNYRYAELVELERTQQVRKKYNVEILEVFPYNQETVKAWFSDLPGQLEKIKTTKNPPDPAKLDEAGKKKMERWRQFFPKDYVMAKDEPLPFTVLVDGERTLSKRLGIFTTDWNGGKVDQNMPSVYIVDKNGILKFKYIGQNTTDRPSYEYLFSILEVINSIR